MSRRHVVFRWMFVGLGTTRRALGIGGSRWGLDLGFGGSGRRRSGSEYRRTNSHWHHRHRTTTSPVHPGLAMSSAGRRPFSPQKTRVTILDHDPQDDHTTHGRTTDGTGVRRVPAVATPKKRPVPPEDPEESGFGRSRGTRTRSVGLWSVATSRCAGTSPRGRVPLSLPAGSTVRGGLSPAVLPEPSGRVGRGRVGVRYKDEKHGTHTHQDSISYVYG